MKNFLLVLMLTASGLATATSTACAQAAKTVAAAPTAGHLRAAEALIRSMYSQDSFAQLTDKALSMRLQTTPGMREFEPEMRAFLSKYMSLEAVVPKLAAIYAQEFSESELNDILRFRNTPTGRKLSEKTPALMQAGMVAGQQIAQEHLPELEEAIKAKAEKIK